MDLPSVLGGLAQGFKDFGTSVVDLFGTGGAAIGDLLQGTGTRNQDDFRKWLYNTNSVQDAAAKGLGTALNGVQTVSDYIPGIGAVTRNPLFNAAQGALGGLADEFKMAGENYDLGRAGQRAAVSGAAALAGSSLGDALKKSANPILQSGLAQGLARGAAGGAINQGGYAAIDGGDVWNSALQGAGMGALLGGATGAMQDFRPRKLTPAEMALTDEEKALRIANAQKQIDDIGPIRRFTDDPNELAKRARVNELQDVIKAYQSGYDSVDDYNAAMAAKRASRQQSTTATTGTRQAQDYMMTHRPTQSGAYGYDITAGGEDAIMPADAYNNLSRYTGFTEPKYLDETVAQLNAARNNPDAEMTIYRATPGDAINDGDWITLSRAYADNHNNTQLGGKGNILEQRVPARDIQFAGDDLMEWGYYPQGKTLDATLADADMAVNNPKLTPEQEAYFKDSVIRDENGNLKPMYHGSPDGTFTVFKDGSFFTDDKDYADVYQDEHAGMATGKKTINPKTYEVYLNVKKPFTMADPEARRIIKDEYIGRDKNYWVGPTDETEVDFTEADNLRNWLKKNHPEYDGLYVNEGGGDDPFAEDGWEEWRGNSVVPFSPNQIKDINNLKPTSDVDIMASRMTPDEMDLARALAGQDMAVNAAREPEGFTYDYDGSDMAAVQRAYNLATQDQARLDGMLKEISDTLGTEFSSAGQKSMKSMLDKIERKVRSGRDYTVSSMKDHTRGKVMMHNFSEIPQVLQELDRRGVPYDTEVVTNDWGYKGYHITYRNPDGISSEIQLTTADHWPAKLESDAIYDEWRNFNLDASTKTERQRYNEAMAKSQALWAKVDFSDFDKTVQSLSDTGRASRSVAPVTSKLGLTQEPSLYTKMPSSSESASMSPSSVTRTFSGTGFDKSPNIDTPPFMDIIPQNTSRTLEGVLSADDLKVNSAKIAPGQLGLFDDLPTQTPKTGTRQVSIFDQPQEGLDYYGGDVETPVIEPTNPYAPVNGQITQAMQDRAAEVLKNWKKNGVPENELYNAINPDTLPAAIKGAKKLDIDGLKSITKDIFGVDDIKKADIGKVVQYAFSDEPNLARYYMGYIQNESPKSSLYKRVQKSAIEAANKKMTGDLVQRLLDSDTIGSDNLLEIKRYTPSDHAIRSGYTAAADEVLSERLGIAPGNTPKYNGPMDTRRSYGRYSHPVYGSGGDLAIFERKMDNPEDAVSTIAHERLHSFQGEAGSRSRGRYSQEVVDAYKELQNDLKDHYKTWEETAERYGRGDTGYWQRTDEQEARMLQNYLENKGYANAPQMAKSYRAGEWGSEINPAFDKFFDKLRELSKRGVALPALAGLLGGGVVLDQVLNSKDSDKDKKKTKRSA